jgi:hypothetical protein
LQLSLPKVVAQRTMLSVTEIICLVLVGAFWGCTNPLLRKGSTEAASSVTDDSGSSRDDDSKEQRCFLSSAQTVKTQLSKFRNVKVWLPYLLNQAGSVLFYFTLSKTDLSLAVPASNALALVFSVMTSHVIGERVNEPVKAVVGAALVTMGVALCVVSSLKEEE